MRRRYISLTPEGTRIILTVNFAIELISRHSRSGINYKFDTFAQFLFRCRHQMLRFLIGRSTLQNETNRHTNKQKKTNKKRTVRQMKVLEKRACFVCGKQHQWQHFARYLSWTARKIGGSGKGTFLFSNISDRCRTKIIQTSTVTLSFSYFKQKLSGSRKRSHLHT